MEGDVTPIDRDALLEELERKRRSTADEGLIEGLEIAIDVVRSFQVTA
jgi:hypothetical protein